MIELTAVEQNALFELEDLMPDTAKPFEDSDMSELKTLGIDVSGAAKAFLADESKSGNFNFVNDMRKSLINNRDLTLRQVRATLNIMRDKVLGIRSGSRFKPGDDPTFDKACKCRECGQGFDNLVAMLQHRVDVHDYKVAWGSKEMALVAPVPVLPVPEEDDPGIDISSVPNGYYAVNLPNSYGTSEKTFLRVTRTRRNKLRNRAYRYGKVIKGAEIIPAGTVEVAELSSDSKRLAGDQRDAQEPGSMYHGEFEDHLLMIRRNPVKAAERFAHTIGRCGRCGKLLTDDISRSDGFGPECVHLVNAHFAEKEWRDELVDAAKTTCPSVGCKSNEGHLVEGETELYECPKGHLWVVRTTK